MTTSTDTLREQVRSHYAAAATTAAAGRPCGCDAACRASEPATEAIDPEALAHYPAADRDAVPATAARASLGCGNPVAVADLRPGETVLDLGSGGGIDLVLSARRVGPTGTVYGLDMTDEMLALAQRTVAEAGVANVHLLKGLIEAVPLPAGSVDVVISNCVVNLSTDKPAVLAEIARVLRPGGRLGISDIVADDRLSPDERAERGSYAGCVAGALSRGELLAGLAAAGLAEPEVTFTAEVGDGIHTAIVRARKPATA